MPPSTDTEVKIDAVDTGAQQPADASTEDETVAETGDGQGGDEGE